MQFCKEGTEEGVLFFGQLELEVTKDLAGNLVIICSIEMKEMGVEVNPSRDDL